MHWSTKDAKHSDSTLSHSFNDKKGLWKSLHNKFYSVTYVNQYRCISNYVRTRIDKTAHYLHINMIKNAFNLLFIKKQDFSMRLLLKCQAFVSFLFAWTHGNITFSHRSMGVRHNPMWKKYNTTDKNFNWFNSILNIKTKQ